MKVSSAIVLILSLFIVNANAEIDLDSTSTTAQHGLYSYKNSDFSVNIGAGTILDYTFFGQDTPSLLQVGTQEDQFEVRILRTLVEGRFNLLGPWNYLFICEYNEFIKDTSNNFCTVQNLQFTYTLPESFGYISFGKMKEAHVYEMVGDSANLPHHERILSPFFEARNIGIRYDNTYAEKRGTFAIGWYNNWLEEKGSFSDNGHQVSARVTGLPYISSDNENYLHLGSSIRYNGGDSNTLRYQGTPGSNVADYYVDTGELEADHAWELNFEFLWSHKGYSVLGEYAQATLSSTSLNNPTFNGYYVTGGWVLTGESRPYDKNVGYARRIIPKKSYGAVELIARYGNVDLDDGKVQGGHFRKWMVGVNWWMDRHWKTSISYGDVDLDRFDTHGRTKMLLLRLQWLNI